MGSAPTTRPKHKARSSSGKMIFIHNRQGDESRMNYWYQKDLGTYDPPPDARAAP